MKNNKFDPSKIKRYLVYFSPALILGIVNLEKIELSLEHIFVSFFLGSILGEEISEEYFPILCEMATNDLENTERQVQSVANAWHEGNIVSALQALESDLKHG